MSITRQDLEKTSDRLADSLSRLQQDSAELQHNIDETLSEVQKEQTTAEQLLQSDWMKQSGDQSYKSKEGTLKKQLRREPSIVRLLRQWTTSDVIRWLEKKGLHKFILTFQRHHVRGEDLAEIRLPFLDNYDHLSVGDKELLLSHVYELLRLESEEQDVVDHFSSPLDREKYMAARQISKDEQHKGRSSPVIYLTTHNSTPPMSPTSPSSVISSPIPKLRKRSEPSIMTELPVSCRQRKVKTLEKIARKKRPVSNRCTLYDLLGGDQKQEIKCVCLHKRGEKFGLMLKIDSTGNLMIVKTDDSLVALLGNRILEINGYLSSQLTDERILPSLLNDSQELCIVLSREQGNIAEDDRWDKLRNVVTNMRDNPDDLIDDKDLKELKDKYTIQEELEKARNEIEVLKFQVDELSEQLSLQTKVMGEMKEQRDNALRTKLRARFNDAGETEYYKLTMDSLNVESATKEEVTESLKEIVKEASRQKFYLDRLISVVIEESPWLLDQVDADFDDNSLVDQHEEFC